MLSCSTGTYPGSTTGNNNSHKHDSDMNTSTLNAESSAEPMAQRLRRCGLNFAGRIGWRTSLLGGALGLLLVGQAQVQLPPPTVVCPIPDAINVNPQDAYIQWRKVSGATAYEWRLLLNGTVIRTATLAADHNYRNAKDLNFNTTYGWRVRALQGTVAGQWMTTVPRFTTMPAPTAPCLLGPANGVNQGSLADAKPKVVFNWSAVPGIAVYDLFVAPSVSGPYTKTTVTGNSAQLELAWNQTYFWYVQGTIMGLTCPASTTWSFTTTLPPFVNQSPVNEAELFAGQYSHVAATFTVAPTPGATSYRFRFFERYNRGMLPVKELVSSTPSCEVHFYSGSVYFGPNLLPPVINKYYWDVVATTPLGQTQSPLTSFYYLGLQTITHPAWVNGTDVTLSWDPIASSTPIAYEVKISAGSYPVTTWQGATTTCVFQPEKYMARPHQPYNFQVRTVYDGRPYGDAAVHYGPWSQPGYFSY